MIDLNKREKIMIGIIISLIILFLGIYFKFEDRNEINDNIIVEDFEEENLIEYNNSVTNSDIIVHISGAVKNPGIVILKEGDRLYQGIEKSGGLTEDADEEKINLSKKLEDEEKIHIPRVGETAEIDDDIISSESEDSSGKININTASKDELMTLTGIGDVTAEKIIEYRQKNKFEKIEDLMEVSGIGEKKFETIKEFITTK